MTTRAVEILERIRAKYSIQNPLLSVNSRHFPVGDFGSLDQISFETKEFFGELDIWEDGKIGVHFWDCVQEKWILNVMHEPNEIAEATVSLAWMERFLDDI